MSCAACERRVDGAHSATDGVSSANVNLATEKAAVEYDPTWAGTGALIRAVEDAGYGVEKRESSFGVTGISCASCAASEEKALRSVPGVIDASVNLAVESVSVEYLAGTAAGRELQRTSEGAGYGVVQEEGPIEDVRALEYGRLRRRFFVAAALTALVVAGSLPMMLGLEVPGWRFYAGAWGALRHGRANMNTLVVVGTSAAYLSSAAATFAPWLLGKMAEVSKYTSALIITLVLLGRLLEARPRSHRRGHQEARQSRLRHVIHYCHGDRRQPHPSSDPGRDGTRARQPPVLGQPGLRTGNRLRRSISTEPLPNSPRQRPRSGAQAPLASDSLQAGAC